jgi:amidase/6-aminohexanoate-cyclic-dimer hydrolase
MAAFKDYENYDATGLAELVRKKQVKPDELLDAAIERVESRDAKVNAVVHKMYDEARRSIAAGLPAAPLAGVPYMLKDLVQMYADVPTSGGSRIFQGFVPDYDTEMTKRLKAAGLVIMGKTNTPEFGMNAATESVALGPCRNPWNLDHGVGGSSGGAAAVVASRVLPAAHATDSGGSIRIPAASCGVFGLKPTRSRTSLGPDIGEGLAGLSTGHAVSISVRDSALLLDLTQGYAVGDPYQAPKPARPYVQEVGADPGKLKIAVMTNAPGGTKVHPECVKAVEAAAKLLAELGHRVEPAAPDHDAEAFGTALEIMGAGYMRAGIDKRLKVLGREQRQGDVETVTALWAESGARYTAADYARSVGTIHTLGRKIEQFLQNYDLLLSPTLAEPPVKVGTLDMMGRDLKAFQRRLLDYIPFTPIFNVSGGPAVSLPIHWSAEGLPVGIQLGARYGDEALLFRISSQIEKAKPWRNRKPPICK